MRQLRRSALPLALSSIAMLSGVSGCGTDASEPERTRLVADVVSVTVRGEADDLRFEVGIESPDTGCDRYADWWEVVDADGRLVYRRVLRHSHAEEQPFVRSGGPVEVEREQTLWVRAHMHPTGYGGQVMKGTVAAGFAPAETPPGFAPDLETSPPLPGACAF